MNNDPSQTPAEPIYEPWILAEASNNLELAALIQRREELVASVAEKGGFHNLELDEREPVEKQRTILNQQILEKKRKLEIESPEG